MRIEFRVKELIVFRVKESKMNESSVMEAYTSLSHMETSISEPESPPTVATDTDRPSSQLLSISRMPFASKLPPKRATFHGSASDDISTGVRLDFVSLLPPEIAVHIMGFLHPRHLCR